ncbi:MAG TPA: hypothetical protein VFQ82_14890, partial [Stellaceae bacterium]|nr:hypothetical protein [Stellaceae bacterium]
MSNRVLRAVIAVLVILSGIALEMPLAAQASGAGNTMTITNRSGVARLNYPLQFGRPFVDGAIAGEPQVLINGAPAASQADVK